MALYAIGDLHLSLTANKSMEVFGPAWENYHARIEEGLSVLTEDDSLILAGDTSWGIDLAEAEADFRFLERFPGKKYLIKGNHDYWWTTLTSMRTFLKENNFQNIDFLYNNSYEYNGYIIAGTRGWTQSEDGEDKRLVKRELIRLELSIQDGIKKYGEEKPIIVCMHYPPIVKGNNILRSEFSELMERYNVKKCIYGHLHGLSQQGLVEGKINDIDYKMVSCDYTNFELIKIT